MPSARYLSPSSDVQQSCILTSGCYRIQTPFFLWLRLRTKGISSLQWEIYPFSARADLTRLIGRSCSETHSPPWRLSSQNHQPSKNCRLIHPAGIIGWAEDHQRRHTNHLKASTGALGSGNVPDLREIHAPDSRALFTPAAEGHLWRSLRAVSAARGSRWKPSYPQLSCAEV